ncbi:MAG: O-antigen ligase family protein [Actinobacteria bacterium]|nr:O-antigen ligase family protein [Actinomycetota bacterium]
MDIPNPVFIVSVILIILLSYASIFSFENSLLILLFLTCVINSLPVIILDIEIFYPIILFAFLGFVIGSGFKTPEIGLGSFNKDIRFKILSVFIILFTITITISVLFTILNNFNLFHLKNLEIHIYNIDVAGANSLDAILFSLGMYLNYIITFILLFLLIKRLKITRRFLTKLFYILFSANILVFFVSLYQIFIDQGFGNQPHWINAGRINSTMINPNSLGFFLILNIGIFTAYLFYLNKKQKFLCLLILLILPLQLLYSGSRTGLLGLAIFALLIIFYFSISILVNLIKNRRKNKNDIMILATTLLLLVIIPLSFSVFLIKTDILKNKPILSERIKNNIEQTQEDNSLTQISSGRNIILPQAVNMIKDYPLVGVGIGTFPLELSNYFKLTNVDSKMVDYTLNTYLQVLSENGIFSFVFFIGFYITMFTIIFNNLKEIHEIKNRKFLIIILFIIFTCLIMFNFVSGTNYFEGQILYSFLLILLLLLSYDLKDNEACENSK